MRPFFCVIAFSFISFFTEGQIQRDHLIGEYLFEGNVNDNSGNGNNLKSVSSTTGNDTTRSEQNYHASRIANAFAYRKNSGSANASITDSISIVFNNVNKDFSVSYWVYNNTGYLAEHFSIHQELKISQFKGGPGLEGYAFPSFYIHMGSPEYKGCCFTSQFSGPTYSWKNYIYTFNSHDSIITKFENGVNLLTFKLNKNAYDMVFRDKFQIKISTSNTNAVVAIDDILIFDKVISESEVESILNYPSEFTLGNILSEGYRLNIFPNPANSYLEVEASEKIKSVLIFDVHGKEIVHNTNVGASNIKLNAEAFPKGILFVRVTTVSNSILTQSIKVE
ncbi:MAG: T9SS type A sorting domain-containing protein [Cytophagaceae bacterium]